MAKGKHPHRRKASGRRPKPVINPNAAGIDIGAREIYVAVPEERDSEAVRTFATFTADLPRHGALVSLLGACAGGPHPFRPTLTECLGDG